MYIGNDGCVQRTLDAQGNFFAAVSDMCHLMYSTWYGGYTSIDPTNSDIIYSSYVYNSLSVSYIPKPLQDVRFRTAEQFII
ncbi:hypothetical protein CJF42_10455 [Pseudoalteromonas sp. NBT06-2]|nr:hypothetical protein CJF42_10455 [Pseudoalteromonas sp. NBT06-2]